MIAFFQDPTVQIVFWGLVKIVVILFVMLGIVAYLTFFERKIAGHIQSRPGPNLVGPWGLFQPFADILKLFLKEEFIPARANKILFHIAPILAVTPALTSFAVIPVGPNFVVTDVNVALLVFLAMSSLGVYALALAGWSSNNKYALLGGLRSAAQMVSYELALGLSTIGVILLAGSLSLVDIVHAQGGAFHLGPLALPRWFVFTQPVAFVVFVVCAFAETNRAPFDLPEGESELVGGFHTEYSSMKWAMFFLGEYMNMLTISSITVTLFLGGWNGPWLPDSLKFLWFFGKLFALIFLFMWVRWTFPRLRYDQLMALGWKVLLPIALLNVLATGMAVAWVGNR
jgi:NADH-quinone oxidoreductase subunit H